MSDAPGGKSEAPATAGAGEVVIYEGREPTLYSIVHWLLAILTVGIYALYRWFAHVSDRRRVTNQRIVTKRGLLSLRTDTFELYRVSDIVVEEPLGERLLGYGRITLNGSDRSDPTFVLVGIKNVGATADKIRQGVEESKRTRRVATLAEA